MPLESYTAATSSTTPCTPSPRELRATADKGQDRAGQGLVGSEDISVGVFPASSPAPPPTARAEVGGSSQEKRMIEVGVDEDSEVRESTQLAQRDPDDDMGGSDEVLSFVGRVLCERCVFRRHMACV